MTFVCQPRCPNLLTSKWSSDVCTLISSYCNSLFLNVSDGEIRLISCVQISMYLISYRSLASNLNVSLKRGKFPSSHLSNEREVVGERGTWYTVQGRGLLLFPGGLSGFLCSYPTQDWQKPGKASSQSASFRRVRECQKRIKRKEEEAYN